MDDYTKGIKMLILNYENFIYILRNKDKTILNKNSLVYKHINGYMNYKNKTGGNYSISRFMRLLANGFKNNKSITYMLPMYF